MHRQRGTITRFGWFAVLGLVGSGALAGCVGYGSPTAPCPELGWFNTLTLELSGDIVEVDHLEVCDDTGCSPPPGARDVFTPQHLGDGRWVVTRGMSVPEHLTVRAWAEDGALLAEIEAEPEWVRVGGSERCGGPHEGRLDVTL